MYRNLLTFILAFSCISIPLCFAEEPERTTISGISFVRPGGWKSLPTAAIRQLNEKLEASTAGLPKQTYQYAIQHGSTDYWFTYPYILVQVNSRGRIPEAELESLEKLDSEVAKAGNEVSQRLGKTVASLKIGKSYYDSQAKIIWARGESELVGVGEVINVTATLLTSKGTVVFYGYARKGKLGRLEEDFEHFVRSVELDVENRY